MLFDMLIKAGALTELRYMKKNCNLEFILGFMNSLFFHFTYEECAEQKWEVTKYLYIFIQISVSSTSYISKLNLLF